MLMFTHNAPRQFEVYRYTSHEMFDVSVYQ